MGACRDRVETLPPPARAWPRPPPPQNAATAATGGGGPRQKKSAGQRRSRSSVSTATRAASGARARGFPTLSTILPLMPTPTLACAR